MLRIATILADHNIEGHAILFWGLLQAEGWTDLLEIKLILFESLGIPHNSTDRDVWQFAQKNNMILLTANRKMNEKDSLEETIREENTPSSLPVITISTIEKLHQKPYRLKCIYRIIEIILDLDNYLGTGRVFIP
ncbi:ACP S-malonyltransferase [Candidatus Magnetomorum sp. HK-1]|nr:ACP S-malonyltransferase [Candidatus Magnetomorum sp. HK-1]